MTKLKHSHHKNHIVIEIHGLQSERASWSSLSPRTLREWEAACASEGLRWRGPGAGRRAAAGAQGSLEGAWRVGIFQVQCYTLRSVTTSCDCRIFSKITQVLVALV